MLFGLFVSTSLFAATDIIILVDNSRSLKSLGGDPLRWIPSSIRSLINTDLKGVYNIGIVRFEVAKGKAEKLERGTRILLPLSPQHTLEGRNNVYFENSLKLLDYEGNWSNFNSGFREAMKCFGSRQNRRIILLITDGRPNEKGRSESNIEPHNYGKPKKNVPWYDKGNAQDTIKYISEELNNESRPVIFPVLFSKLVNWNVVDTLAKLSRGKVLHASKPPVLEYRMLEALDLEPPKKKVIPPKLISKKIGIVWGYIDDDMPPKQFIKYMQKTKILNYKDRVNFFPVDIRHSREISIPKELLKQIEFDLPHIKNTTIRKILNEIPYDYVLVVHFKDEYTIDGHLYSMNKKNSFYSHSAKRETRINDFLYQLKEKELSMIKEDHPVQTVEVPVSIMDLYDRNVPNILLKINMGKKGGGYGIEMKENYTDADGNARVSIPYSLVSSEAYVEFFPELEEDRYGKRYPFYSRISINQSFWAEFERNGVIKHIIPEKNPDNEGNYYLISFSVVTEKMPDSQSEIRFPVSSALTLADKPINGWIKILRHSQPNIIGIDPDFSGVPNELRKFFYKEATFRENIETDGAHELRWPLDWYAYIKGNIAYWSEDKTYEMFHTFLSDIDAVKMEEGTFELVKLALNKLVNDKEKYCETCKLMKATKFPYRKPQNVKSGIGTMDDQIDCYYWLVRNCKDRFDKNTLSDLKYQGRELLQKLKKKQGSFKDLPEGESQHTYEQIFQENNSQKTATTFKD